MSMNFLLTISDEVKHIMQCFNVLIVRFSSFYNSLQMCLIQSKFCLRCHFEYSNSPRVFHFIYRYALMLHVYILMEKGIKERVWRGYVRISLCPCAHFSLSLEPVASPGAFLCVDCLWPLVQGNVKSCHFTQMHK